MKPALPVTRMGCVLAWGQCTHGEVFGTKRDPVCGVPTVGVTLSEVRNNRLKYEEGEEDPSHRDVLELLAEQLEHDVGEDTGMIPCDRVSHDHEMMVIRDRFGMSSHSIFVTGVIMNTPTRSRRCSRCTGDRSKSGSRKRERRKRTATTKAVKPVRPPSTTPAEDSTNVVTVEVPNTAPTVVPTESAKRASLTLGIVPSGLIMSALVAHPIRVPTVSNISTKRKVNMMITKSTVKTYGSTRGEEVRGAEHRRHLVLGDAEGDADDRGGDDTDQGRPVP